MYVHVTIFLFRIDPMAAAVFHHSWNSIILFSMNFQCMASKFLNNKRRIQLSLKTFS